MHATHYAPQSVLLCCTTELTYPPVGSLLKAFCDRVHFEDFTWEVRSKTKSSAHGAWCLSPNALAVDHGQRSIQHMCQSWHDVLGAVRYKKQSEW